MKPHINIINKAEDYIEEHLSETISLKDLADNAHYSEYHFHRLFKKYSKESIKQFITRIKMERSAIFLITNPSLSITDIAFRYGYNDSSSYTRAFKRHYHMSPTQFRKKQETSRTHNQS